MTTKYIPMPPNSIGGFLYKHRNCLKFMNIVAPQEVTVPIEIERSSVRSAVEDYYCSSCPHKVTPKDYDNIETLKSYLNSDKSLNSFLEYCKENNKCPGSKRFGTKGCLAGYTNESDFFQVSQAKFTTPIIGLEVEYELSFSDTRKFKCKFLGNYFWYAFLDPSLSSFTVYNNFNVFDIGRTCWGDREIPKTPASAYTEFFSSLTTKDLTQLNGRSLKYAIENWEPQLEIYNTTEKYPLNNILAKCLVNVERPLSGVLISNSSNWIDNVAKQDLVKIDSDQNLFIGWVRKTSTGCSLICGKHLIYIVSNLNTRSKPTVLCRRKEFNF